MQYDVQRKIMTISLYFQQNMDSGKCFQPERMYISINNPVCCSQLFALNSPERYIITFMLY